MSKERRRVYSREFKLSVIERMEAGEQVSALSRELGVPGVRIPMMSPTVSEIMSLGIPG